MDGITQYTSIIYVSKNVNQRHIMIKLVPHPKKEKYTSNSFGNKSPLTIAKNLVFIKKRMSLY